MKIPASPSLSQLDAYRKAKLGTLYGKFWVAPGLRFPSEFNEQGLWEPLPPKKPAESVRFAREEVRLKKACGAELSIPRHSESVASPLPMAATASAYRKPPQSTSENIAGDSPFVLLEKAKASDLHPRDRMVLVTALEEGNRFAAVETTNEIFVATLTIAVQLGSPSITVRRSIDRLEAKGIFVLRYPENWAIRDGRGYQLRRPRTYQINAEKLSPRMTLKEHRKKRFGELSARQKSRHSSASTSPASSHTTIPASAPAPQAAAATPPPTAAAAAVPQIPAGSRAHDRMRKLRLELVAKMTELMRGVDHVVGLDGLGIRVGPGDRRYRAPMSQEKALIAACMTLGISEDEAREQLKLCHWKFGESESP
jgi:hypothetical protein